jgi:hypothetical protein
MKLQALVHFTLGTMTSSTILQLATTVFIILLCTFLVAWAMFKNGSKTEPPVMEAGRAKGKMALGNKDYESN